MAQLGNRALRVTLVLALTAGWSAVAQDVFADWYPQALRFTLETRIDGEVAQVAEYFVGERALRVEAAGVTMLLRDEEGPVLYYIDEGTGAVDRLDDPDPGLVGTILPMGSPHHPCATSLACERVGDDTWNGRAVVAWEIEIPGVGRTTVWVDQDTRVQVRSEGTADDGSVVTSEATNLEVGTQPAELFEPPQP